MVLCKYADRFDIPGFKIGCMKFGLDHPTISAGTGMQEPQRFPWQRGDDAHVAHDLFRAVRSGE
jgi:hypothetical protein